MFEFESDISLISSPLHRPMISERVFLFNSLELKHDEYPVSLQSVLLIKNPCSLKSCTFVEVCYVSRAITTELMYVYETYSRKIDVSFLLNRLKVIRI